MTPAERCSSALVLLAHGSRDLRAAETVAELTEQVATRLPDTTVRAAYLDHSEPAALDLLLDLVRSRVRSVTVVPLLFAPGFHIRTDLPEVIAQARSAAPDFAVQVAPTLAEAGDDPAVVELLLDALDRRLGATGSLPRALVLAAAGSSDGAARAVIHELAAQWGERHQLPAAAAFASGPGLRPEAAVSDLAARHSLDAAHVIVGSLFLADGFLPGRVARSAAATGAACAPVLGAAPELVELVLRRLAGQAAHARVLAV